MTGREKTPAEQNAADKLTEADFKVFFAFSLDLFCILDLDFRIININPAVAKVFGFRVEECIGRPVCDFLHPDDKKRVFDSLQSAVKSGLTIQRLEARALSKEGEYVWSEWTCNPLLATGSVYCIGRDVTATKKAEEALKASEALLREAQMIAKLGYYDFDAASGTWRSSVLLDEIFGIPGDYPKTFEGWLDIVHPEDRLRMRVYFDDYVLKGHHSFDMEYRIKSMLDGKVKWVHGFGRVEYDAEGKPRAMIGTVQDISERKKVELELKMKIEELEKHNKLMLGREKRLIELKKEVDDLLKSIGKPPKYGV